MCVCDFASLRRTSSAGLFSRTFQQDFSAGLFSRTFQQDFFSKTLFKNIINDKGE
jgi:hypothetical protein